MNWLDAPCVTPDADFLQSAKEQQQQLTKPQGSLGQLESIAIRLASLQKRHQPTAEKVAISVFAADHGVSEEGVSAFPQEVTVQMVANFLQGGAAISVLAQQLDAQLEVVDVGILSPLAEQQGLVHARAGAGTANSSRQAAMSGQQLVIAMRAGRDAVDRVTTNPVDVFIGGEMGIGNTTSATALYCALLNVSPDRLTGAGTGLDSQGILHKSAVIKRILAKHQTCGDDILEWLRCAVGFEIVALTASYIRAAQQGLAVLVDGFISTVAALCAIRIKPCVQDWLFFTHTSAEQGHKQVLSRMNEQPLLDLQMRLGEGSGAAVAVPLMRLACALHNDMATFEEAAVANRT